MSDAKILVIDIETAPMLFWGWQLGEQVVRHDQIERDSYMLCYAAKFIGEKKIYFDAVWKHKLFKRDPHTDKMIAKTVHNLLSSADIIVGQNSDKFDLKKINTAFLLHDLKPLPPHCTVDTLKVSRSKFYFASHGLDYVSYKLGFGGKEKHDGMPLWLRCIKGCKKSHKKMESYNKTDIIRTEQIYMKMRPFMKNHPLNRQINGGTDGKECPLCHKESLQRHGVHVNARGKFYRYQCMSCGKWSLDKKPTEAFKQTKV